MYDEINVGLTTAKAKELLETAKRTLPIEDVMSLQAENLVELNYKLKLQQKIKLMQLSLVK